MQEFFTRGAVRPICRKRPKYPKNINNLCHSMGLELILDIKKSFVLKLALIIFIPPTQI